MSGDAVVVSVSVCRPAVDTAKKASPLVTLTVDVDWHADTKKWYRRSSSSEEEEHNAIPLASMRPSPQRTTLSVEGGGMRKGGGEGGGGDDKAVRSHSVLRTPPALPLAGRGRKGDEIRASALTDVALHSRGNGSLRALVSNGSRRVDGREGADRERGHPDKMSHATTSPSICRSTPTLCGREYSKRRPPWPPASGGSPPGWSCQTGNSHVAPELRLAPSSPGTTSTTSSDSVAL